MGMARGVSQRPWMYAASCAEDTKGERLWVTIPEPGSWISWDVANSFWGPLVSKSWPRKDTKGACSRF